MAVSGTKNKEKEIFLGATDRQPWLKKETPSGCHELPDLSSLLFNDSPINERQESESREERRWKLFPRASLWNSLIDLWLAKDNRLLNPKSSYERILMAPTCRLIARASRRFHHPFQLLVLVPVCLSLSSLGFLFDRHDFPSFSYLSFMNAVTGRAMSLCSFIFSVLVR